MKTIRTLVICLLISVVPTVAKADLPIDRLEQITYTPKHTECTSWLTLAFRLGWQRQNLSTLERVMWRESRCQPGVHNPKDPNGGSYGLTQINGFWCRPTAWYPKGYLQHFGVVRVCADLFRPEQNLLAALEVFNYSKGWTQWYLP